MYRPTKPKRRPSKTNSAKRTNGKTPIPAFSSTGGLGARSTVDRVKSSSRKPRNSVKSSIKKPIGQTKRKKKRLKWGRLVVAFFGATALGYGAFWMIHTGIGLLWEKIRTDIQQVIASTAPKPYSRVAYSSLSRDISDYLNKESGTYSVSGQDLQTGATFGENPQTSFSAGLTVALPIAITLYEQIATGHLSPSAIVSLASIDRQAGNSLIGGMPIGTEFTVSELARLAITKDDVVATNMLLRKIGSPLVNSMIAQMGGKTPLTEPYRTTPADLTAYLAYFYKAWIHHPGTFAPLFSDLTAVPSEGRIAAEFAPDAPVAHITGDWPSQFHDAALITTTRHPVALSICSDGVSYEDAARVESHVAELVKQFEETGV